MLQDNLIYIVLIALVGAIAITVSYFISRKEHNFYVKSHRLEWLKSQTAYTLDAITTLKAAGCRADLIERMNQHALGLIEEISRLAPDSDLMTQVNNQKETADRTPSGQGQFTNDKDLKRFQIYVNYTEKLMTQWIKKGKMSPTLAKNIGKDLYWLNISVVAEAHINQANILIQQEDKLTALSHLKHAKAVVVRAMVPQNKKQPILDRIQPQIEIIQPRKVVQGGALEDSIDSFLK